MKSVRLTALLLLAVLTVTACFLAGCGKDTSEAPESLDGTVWKVETYKEGDVDFLDNIKSGASENGYKDAELKATFGSDTVKFTVTYKDDGNEETKDFNSGEYTYKDGKLTLSGLEASSVAGNTIIFNGDINDTHIEMTLKKQS